MANYSQNHIIKPTIDESDLTYHDIIGYGGFGEVYRVIWKLKHSGEIEAAAKKIAIPRNRQDIPEQLLNEIKFLQTLNHPNIIKYYGLAVTSTHAVLVTEYAAKGSLNKYLKTKKKLPCDLKKKWMLQGAEGLKYLRDNNVLHRDIKSHNLLITADDDLKICDFDISKELTSTKTTNNPDTGTVKWMAPEIFKDSQVSPKADIFAFGIVLWELETCEEPYKGNTTHQVMWKVGSEDVRPEIPETCPLAMKSLIQKCWHTDRYQRPDIENVIGYLKALPSLETNQALGELTRIIIILNLYAYTPVHPYLSRHSK